MPFDTLSDIHVPRVSPVAGGILALDLSGNIGWCYGGPRQTPHFGAAVLPHIGGFGCRMASAENWLIKMFDMLMPERCIVEAPMGIGQLFGKSPHTTMRVLQQQLGLHAIVFSEAWRHSVPCSEIDVGSVRLAFLGRRFFPRTIAKRLAVQFCWQRGWKVPSHDAADATLTWLWLCNRMMGVPAAGPIFERTWEDEVAIDGAALGMNAGRALEMRLQAQEADEC